MEQGAQQGATRSATVSVASAVVSALPDQGEQARRLRSLLKTRHKMVALRDKREMNCPLPDVARIGIYTSFAAVFLRLCRFDVRGVCDSRRGDFPIASGLGPKLAAEPQALGGKARGKAEPFRTSKRQSRWKKMCRYLCVAHLASFSSPLCGERRSLNKFGKSLPFSGG